MRNHRDVYSNRNKQVTASEPEQARWMGRHVIVQSVDGKIPAKPGRQEGGTVRKAVLWDILSLALVLLGIVGVAYVSWAAFGALGLIAWVSAMFIAIGLMLGRS